MKVKSVVLASAVRVLIAAVCVAFFASGSLTTSTALSSEIIVDNAAASFTGSWSTSTYYPNYHGTNYKWSSPGNGADTATWTFNIPTAGNWQVYAWWTNAANKATDAPYTITHAAGSTTIDKNQQTNGGSWQLLGTFNFNTGTHNVRLTDNANGEVVADAIRLIPASSETVVDNSGTSLGVFSDSACTKSLASVDWGTVYVGGSVSRTVYVKNVGISTMTLSLSTKNWNPAAANGSVSVSWNRQGTTLAAGQVISATLTLSVSSSASSLTNFSVDTVITGTG